MPHKIKPSVIYRRAMTVRLELEERRSLQQRAREADLSLAQFARQALGLPIEPDGRRRVRTAQAPPELDRQSIVDVDLPCDKPLQ
jgi:hypothetical protein